MQLKSVSQAQSLGIRTVYQDLALVNDLSVYHNMFLNGGVTLKPLPFLNNRKMKERTRRYLDDMGVNIPSIDAEVAMLSGGQRQAIAVARDQRDLRRGANRAHGLGVPQGPHGRVAGRRRHPAVHVEISGRLLEATHQRGVTQSAA